MGTSQRPSVGRRGNKKEEGKCSCDRWKSRITENNVTEAPGSVSSSPFVPSYSFFCSFFKKSLFS